MLLTQELAALQASAGAHPQQWRREAETLLEPLCTQLGGLDKLLVTLQNVTNAHAQKLGVQGKSVEACAKDLQSLKQAGKDDARRQDAALTAAVKRVTELEKRVNLLPDRWRADDQQRQQQFEERMTQMTRRAEAAEARMQAQEEVLTELSHRSQADHTRLSRFLTWFTTSGGMARMRGKPE